MEKKGTKSHKIVTLKPSVIRFYLNFVQPDLRWT